MSRLTLVAHPDDDLLFLNPDVASDIQAGHTTWVIYLTAGNVVTGAAGMPYADQRIQGVRAAYARAAKVTGPAAVWNYQLITLPGGRSIATNWLQGAPHVHLAFTFVSAAAGADNGDLYRMWTNPAHAATPIDGRPSYTKSTFTAMLREFITHVNPDFLRITDPSGQVIGDNIDHTYAGKFAAAANLNAVTGTVTRRMDSYFGYAAGNFPSNSGGYWETEKLAIWNAYKPLDPVFPAGSVAWDEMASRQHRRNMWLPGDPYRDF